MRNRETRYAVIIGIDDYSNDPLSFCANDANSIEESLIKNCMFKEDNIFKIISTTQASEKDITGKYLEAIRNIKTKFISNQDSILFYFAGHGSYKNNKSVIWFQESSYPIEDIFRDVSELNPKIQIYMIDSCKSGSKVLTRDKSEELNKYINSSKGAMFLYACQNTESALELGSLKHGLLTYNLLKAIDKKELYDNDGYLTFNGIIDFVQKETSKASDFEQIPVIENNITGFYPFAIDNEKINLELIEKEHNLELIEKEQMIMGIERNKDKLRNLRDSLQKKASILMNNSINKIDIENYQEIEFKNLDNLDYEGIDKLEEKIVNYVTNQNLTPLKNLIYRKVEKKDYNNHFYGGIIKSFNMLNNSPQEEIYNIINFNNEYIDSKFNIYLSDIINKTSFGIGYLNYQAKWGIVMLKIIFRIDWDGECDNDIKNITISHIPIVLEEKSLEMVDKIEISFNDIINENLGVWNIERENELDKYRVDLEYRK